MPLAGREWVGRATPGLVLGALVVPLVVPLPAVVLDGLLVANLALGLVLLGASLEGWSAATRARLPTLLLGTALFRLAVEVAASRLLLGRGVGGAVIGSLGRWATRGDVVVGVVVLVFLGVVQYLVVAKGGERAAEVAARFALDAMPGQQLSLDAELRAGVIGSGEASRRREALLGEARFYGAMDGALRFVRGESLAGMVITATNFVAGVGLGVMRDQEALRDALAHYGTLAVGQGLAAQLPSLFVAAAAGMAVTAPTGSREEAPWLRTFVVAHTASLGAVAVVAAGLSVVPSMPAWALVSVAGVAGYAAWWGGREKDGNVAVRFVVGAPSGDDRAAVAAWWQARLAEVGFESAAVAVVDEARSSVSVDGVHCGEGETREAAWAIAMRRHASTLWSLSATREALDRAEARGLATAMREAKLELATVAWLLASLTEEGVTFGRVDRVLDAALRVSSTSDRGARLAAVRRSLGAAALGVREEAALPVWRVSSEVVEAMRSPKASAVMDAELRAEAAEAWEGSVDPKLVLTEGDVRRRVWEALGRRFVVRVVAREELDPEVMVTVEGTLGPPDEA